MVGASAGGVEALFAILPALPAGLRGAVFVVLHLPRDGQSLLAEIFGPKCALPVREAEDKEPVEPGTIYFAPPDYHLLVDAGPRLSLSADEPVHYSRPSIDVLFESAADAYGERLLGILLTGANHDGAAGCGGGAARRRHHARAAADSAQSPLMPQAALERLADPDLRAGAAGQLAALLGTLAPAMRRRCDDTARRRERIKCIIVDDLEENLIALAALLERTTGIDVLIARPLGCAAGASSCCSCIRWPLALIDVQMPDMDGFELAELMRGSERTRHRIPIIFVTAGAGDQRRVFKGYESGAVDFLLKPIEPHVLKSKARVFFQLYRQQLQLADELRERTETLRMNELFTAMLGHDLRGPLSAIVLAAMIIEKKTADETTRRMAGRAISSARSSEAA